jgi:hypothetical protein
MMLLQNPNTDFIICWKYDFIIIDVSILYLPPRFLPRPPLL